MLGDLLFRSSRGSGYSVFSTKSLVEGLAEPRAQRGPGRPAPFKGSFKGSFEGSIGFRVSGILLSVPLRDLRVPSRALVNNGVLIFLRVPLKVCFKGYYKGRCRLASRKGSFKGSFKGSLK